MIYIYDTNKICLIFYNDLTNGMNTFLIFTPYQLPYCTFIENDEIQNNV